MEAPGSHLEIPAQYGADPVDCFSKSRLRQPEDQLGYSADLGMKKSPLSLNHLPVLMLGGRS